MPAAKPTRSKSLSLRFSVAPSQHTTIPSSLLWSSKSLFAARTVLKKIKPADGKNNSKKDKKHKKDKTDGTGKASGSKTPAAGNEDGGAGTKPARKAKKTKK